MCGIVGVAANHRANPAVFEQARDLLSHRGPDDAGLFASPDGKTVLGHRRLSILDLTRAGHQPMATPDGRFHLTYNGEIYNFMELREQLSSRGDLFRSRTDTEVALRSLAVRKQGAMQEWRGMFALALWDTQENDLLIARDRLGKKPLYYADSEQGFFFASELKALVQSGLVGRQVSIDALAGYLKFGSVQEPAAIIHNTAMLPAGTWMRTRQNGGQPVSYWKPGDATITSRSNTDVLPAKLQTDARMASEAFAERAYDSVLEELRDRLIDSTRLRLVSDVPVGVFLSGGIDSASLLALMRSAGCSTIRTFTAGFREEGYDESPLAAQSAAAFETEHIRRTFGPDEVWNEMPKIIAAMDQPTVDGINTYFISKVAKEGGVTVALSGLGADELLGGYPSFRLIPKLMAWGKVIERIPGGVALARQVVHLPWLPPAFSKVETILDGEPSMVNAYRAVRGLFVGRSLSRLCKNDLLRAAEQPEGDDGIVPPDPERGISRLELRRYMLNQLLRDTDAMSMAHSLEVRCPFLDHTLVEFILSLPAPYRTLNPPKKLLLDAVGKHLPRAILDRPKRGFSFPIEVWMRGPWREPIEEVLLSPHPLDAWLNQKEIGAIWQRYLAGREAWGRVWALVVLKMWFSHYGLTI